MILSGEKKEEYREVSQYYSSRFKKYLPWLKQQFAERTIREYGAEGVPFEKIRLRAGYSAVDPTMEISGKITVGSGRPEWGAEPGKEYYILHIEKADPVLNYDMIRSKEHDF
jgi:hypothetical protein